MSESAIGKTANRRRLWPLWAMVIIFALPVAVAWFYYFNPEYLPETRANRGELIEPVRPWPADLRLLEPDGRAFDPATLADRWTLLTVSRSPCEAAAPVAGPATIRAAALRAGRGGRAAAPLYS